MWRSNALIPGAIVTVFISFLLATLNPTISKHIESLPLSSIKLPDLPTMSFLRTFTSRLLTHPLPKPKPTVRSFTTASKMAETSTFLDVVRNRRTYYALTKHSPISDARIHELVKEAVLHVPSAFNVQSARLLVLLGKDHDAFWDIVGDTLKPFVSGDAAVRTADKIAGFKGAYGSILFYESTPLVQKQQKDFPLYADKFPQWSEHTSAMHQFVLWAGLEAEGFGANLQHYNPIVDEPVAKKWNVPKDWSLKAQLVFGGKAGPPAGGEKKQTDLQERVRVFGAQE